MRRETETTQGKLKMCRANVDRVSAVHRDDIGTSSPRFPSLGASASGPITSRPDRVPARRSLGPGGDRRIPQPSDETICGSCSSDVRASLETSVEDGFVTRRWLRPSPPRLRPFPPVPFPGPGSSQIVLARWYVLTRRPPRQSNAANRLFRSATHPVATSTKRYIDVHNAVNCTAAKKAQKLHPS